MPAARRRAMKGATRSRCTRLTQQPPQPAPVRRAPKAPASGPMAMAQSASRPSLLHS